MEICTNIWRRSSQCGSQGRFLSQQRLGGLILYFQTATLGRPGIAVFEVGTGHKPIIPILFSLMGAERVFTIDLHRRVNENLLTSLLCNLVALRESIENSLCSFSDVDTLCKRFDLMDDLRDKPFSFFERVGIIYKSPSDAAKTGLTGSSIDVHLSNTVLEHIPRKNIHNIFKEAYRLLRDDGVALHFIDLSDHFQQQNSSISPVHFLRFSEKQWELIADNQFAYTNRLRCSEYLSIFEKNRFQIINKEVRSVLTESQRKKTPINNKFSTFTDEDLFTIRLRVLLSKKE